MLVGQWRGSASFQLIGEPFYAKDKTHIYYGDKPMATADYQTFRYVGNSYAKDKGRVYGGGEERKGIDPQQCTKEQVAKCSGNKAGDFMSAVSGSDR